MTGAIGPHDLRLLRQAIEARLGLVVHAHQLDNLAAAATEACERFGLSGPAALHATLAGAAEDGPLLEHFIERLTVGESYFFRDAAQMDFLRQEFLPRLIEQRRQGTRALRVWSAACAAGQELHSVSMILAELLGSADDVARPWRLHLVGTDINAQALCQARAGEYTRWSLRGLDDARRERFFTEASSGRVRLRPELAALAKFSYLNLVDGGFPSIVSGLHDFDLILCRNVFVYFEPSRARRVLARLTQALSPGGALLLGASDIVEPHIEGLVTVQQAGMCYYRKPLIEAELRVPAPSSRGADAWAELRALADAGRWSEMAARAETAGAPPDARSARLLALALGNLGRAAEALACCVRALERAPDDHELHFLRALLSVEAGDEAAALEAFRRTLKAAPDCIEAHHQMALLLLRVGQQAPGLRSLKNALDLARSLPAQAEAPGHPGLSYARLADIIENEMTIHAQVEANG